jgi:lipopolysaccharide/colanic/teichoic acid biosynthesis glycosyltransferase
MVKRLFDIVVSLVGLAALLPAMTLIALLVKLGSKGPVLYRGVRVGKNGTPFHILKYRTMVVAAENLGASSTAGDDPRITRTGAFLRKWKLDELPQLWNVFIGEMSFVGPRPQVQWAVDLYTMEERDLLTVRPGITDYASLVFRNEAEILRGSVDPDRDYLIKIAPAKVRLGLAYVRKHNLGIDLTIILATLGALAGVDPTWCLPQSERRSAPISAPESVLTS